jgi:hypothetical protein
MATEIRSLRESDGDITTGLIRFLREHDYVMWPDDGC